MKKIYISGKITGLEIEEARENFSNAEKYLGRLIPVCKVINPMKEVPYEEGKKWISYMYNDIKLLITCKYIYMLNNWHDSRGARIEHLIARMLFIEIIYQ